MLTHLFKFRKINVPTKNSLHNTEVACEESIFLRKCLPSKFDIGEKTVVKLLLLFFFC